MRKYAPMAKPKDNRPIPIALRRSITWRIPIDLLERIDAIRGERQTRTDVVVRAIARYLATEGRRR